MDSEALEEIRSTLMSPDRDPVAALVMSASTLAECEPAGIVPGHPMHRPVEPRRGPAVEPQLALAGGEPQRRRAEVEIGKGDRLLDLPGQCRRQEHPRDVRLRFPDRSAAAGGQLLLEKGERAPLRVVVAHPGSVRRVREFEGSS